MRRIVRVAPLLASGIVSVAAIACGSEQSKLEHGDVVGTEQAVPGSAEAYGETTAERQQQEIDEEQRKTQAEFEADQQLAP